MSTIYYYAEYFKCIANLEASTAIGVDGIGQKLKLKYRETGHIPKQTETA